MSDVPVQLENVSRSFRRRRGSAITALNGVSLTLDDGDYAALLGPNGSGKSTLLRILCGSVRPDSGDVRIFSFPPGSAEAARLRGVVFQSPAIDPLLTIRENLRLQASLVNLPHARTRIDQVAAMFGITDRLDDRCGSLSGGLQRRVDLARAMLAGPRLLLLDEPTAGLDPAARADFLDLVDRLRLDGGTTILMSTHLFDEAQRASRVLLMHQGALVRDGTPDALRAECGVRVIRAAIDAGDVLRSTGLALDPPANGQVVARQADDNPETIALAAHALAASGIAFEVGPPTLADVYFKATGRRLERSEP